MKTYVWSLPTRVFHWLLVFYIFIAFMSDEFMRLHFSIGIGIFILIIFRIIWFFIGPKYSILKDWNFKNFKDFNKEYLSHNPIASVVFIGMILTILLTVITGLLAYFYGSYFKEVHEAFTNILIFFILLHLGGLSIDYLIHKRKTIFSMFNGYKELDGEDVKLNFIQKIVSFIFILSAIVVPIYIFLSYKF